MANTRRKLLFGLSVSLFVTAVLFATLLAVDVYLHHRHEMNAGLNVQGYRGPVLDDKQDGERRVAVIGGSTAFGYGVTWPEAIPALLQQKLNEVRSEVLHLRNVGHEKGLASRESMILEERKTLQEEFENNFDELTKEIKATKTSFAKLNKELSAAISKQLLS